MKENPKIDYRNPKEPSAFVDVLGLGVVANGYGNARELAAVVGASAGWRELTARAAGVEEAAIEGHDRVAQLAIGAAWQAWTMADSEADDREKTGLIYVSAWGSIDSTQAYLESMFEAAGRYASPRHFSRSVYSAGASAIAIHFGIKGPCATLAFDAYSERGRGAVNGALRQAWRFLATRRCQRVLVVWADQSCELAEDLLKRAAQRMGRREYQRYLDGGLGYGATALVVGAYGGVKLTLPLRNECTPLPTRGRPFPMDAAVGLLEWLVRRPRSE